MSWTSEEIKQAIKIFKQNNPENHFSLTLRRELIVTTVPDEVHTVEHEISKKAAVDKATKEMQI